LYAPKTAIRKARIPPRIKRALVIQFIQIIPCISFSAFSKNIIKKAER